jgi:hypothetical protein
MDYFAGLDISMDETHVCVVDREGCDPAWKSDPLRRGIGVRN